MNKGRNIMLLLCCLLLVGCLTFFARTKSQNSSAVVDDVRYVLKSAEDNVKNYEFYFTDDLVMTGTLQSEKDLSTMYLYIRGEYNEELDEYEKHFYSYYYVIEGDSRKNASVECFVNKNADTEINKKFPEKRFSDDVFISLAFGTEPYISIPQAFTVGIIAVLGGAVILKAEELWHIIYRKPEDDTPVWEDMNGIKRTGIGILIFAAALLIFFIAI